MMPDSSTSSDGGFDGGGGAGAGGSGPPEDPLWETVNTWPPIVACPTRLLPVFAATRKVTVPSAFPAAPETTVSHESVAEADHPQPESVTRPTVTVPPADPIEALELLNSNRHWAAPWLSWRRSPSTMTAAER